MFQKVEKGYSFGGGSQVIKKVSKDDRRSPGPGQYGVESGIKLKKAAPSFGFGTDSRDKGLSGVDALGPGSYESKGAFEKAVQRRSFRLTSQRP